MTRVYEYVLFTGKNPIVYYDEVSGRLYLLFLTKLAIVLFFLDVVKSRIGGWPYFANGQIRRFQCLNPFILF